MSIDIEQEALEALADAGLGADDPPEAFVLGYKAGRTSRATDEEAMAAVEDFEYHTYAYTPSRSRSVACSCGERFTGRNGAESYRLWTIHVGRSLLDAARKQVSDE
jgi:hypothetical protein